ncbi:MAG: phosphoribosylformylglycinamidine synthase [Weeksellaceae bacterium]|nr:phosphoribosylformylglycinamidine synthase [Weeksellaceae bacterium]
MNQRLFIEKKPEFDGLSQNLTQELQLIVPEIQAKAFIVYDIFTQSDAAALQAIEKVLADPVTDIVHRDFPDLSEYDHMLAVEFLPGQYDQRADSAMQAASLITGKADVRIRSAVLYAFNNLSVEDAPAISDYLINTVEAREKNLEILEYPASAEVTEVADVEGFLQMDEAALADMHKDWGFSFGLDDLIYIQKYFYSESRNPTETELKALDTYWSDHCRHTTFFTELTEIEFAGSHKGRLEYIFEKYLEIKGALNRQNKPISLMDLGTIAAKHLKSRGLMEDWVITDEINACTIRVDATVDGKKEAWYVLFKNETHNHPTEIEPFGGASTCLGGAIRDPLSGRAFVYQAMRVSGSGNPLESIDETWEGKLPQRKITKEAANGFSSYGNQIGLATTHVSEIYHEGYKAKRMEVGFVVGAAPVDWIERHAPVAGDTIVILGGKTGRDGVGGATGSSKTQTLDALGTMGSEVQKGDAVQERKIQRLFRNPEATRLIKKSNDFGAGGVSVAIGEIADGVRVNLDLLPVKYDGLSGTELAISESQERMAVVLRPEDVERFVHLAETENLLALQVGEVTDSNRLQLYHQGRAIIDLDREFLNSAGCSKKAIARVETQSLAQEYDDEFTEAKLIAALKNLNVASQKGLIEKFDSTVGQTTVLMPLGGKTQLTPALSSAQTLPALHGDCTTVSMASWGYLPKISEQNVLLGGAYAVVESIAKLVASGGDYRKVRLSFQEYFERLGQDATRWGKPLGALLGALDAQLGFEVAAIGGKDSMSGTFGEHHVPPTLISFALCTAELENVISPEFKRSKNLIGYYRHEALADGMPNYESLTKAYQRIHKLIEDKVIISAQIVGEGGLATALAMSCFGNEIGVDISYTGDWYHMSPGSILFECTEELDDFLMLGSVTFDHKMYINGAEVDINDLIPHWKKPLESIFPTHAANVVQDADRSEISATIAHKHAPHTTGIVRPVVAMPIFAGTNCEYETQKVFEEENAIVNSFIFNNLTPAHLQQSVDKLAYEIRRAQILMLPGGFSAGDEPDGSAKFIVSVLKNSKIKDAVHDLIQRNGLILGICNGFQALVKSGLLPYGEIRDLDEDSPTLTHNHIGRHISQMVDVKVYNARSPWLYEMKDEVYRIPASHGEGRFVVNEKGLMELITNQQIATQYVDLNGNIGQDMPFNPNGSVFGIEGITDISGRIFGRMGHPERYREGLLKNIPDAVFMNIFKNGVEYFK